MDEIKVTVFCMAFNHAKYIRDALEGFVSQRTDFPFEVIVHDDASTDGTALIIKEFQSRYPDIVKPVFQKENQYSQGVNIARTFIYPLIRGEYVALCEGDDYWTDPYKLQKQVDALDAHPESDICSHRALRLKNGRFDGWIAPRIGSGIVPAEKVILGGGGWFCATSSFLCRKEAYMSWTPIREVIVIDYTLAIQCALRGGMVYLKDSMSAYRVGTEGSWTTRHDKKARIKNRLIMIEMLDALDKWTSGRYKRVINRRREMFRSDILLLTRDYLSLYSPSRLGINIARMAHSAGRVVRRWLSFL
ncbi:MAG: glycosyltransferase [Bacteroidales bacterium]|nr:glycosyltransferase [Bacteroidales bacterium]